MVVGKLRMKNSPGPSSISSETDKPKRKRRQVTRSPSVDPTPPPYGYTADEAIDVFPSGSSSRSRTHRDSKGKQRATDPQLGEELVINWTTTSAQVANRLLSLPAQNDREFKLRLQDALSAEEDVRFESLLEEDQYLPQRWRSTDPHRHLHADLGGHRLGQMSSEEYDEYVRKRMWSRTNRTHYLNSKDREARQEEERLKASQARAQQKKENEEKIKLRAERETRRKEKEMKKCRATYQQRWELINSLYTTSKSRNPDQPHAQNMSYIDNARQILRFHEIPWPIYPAELLIESAFLTTPLLDQLTHRAIKEFLFGHLTDSDLVERKKVIKTALLAYHPDRFDRLVSRIKDVGGGQEKARELGLRVSQILNELNQDL